MIGTLTRLLANLTVSALAKRSAVAPPAIASIAMRVSASGS